MAKKKNKNKKLITKCIFGVALLCAIVSFVLLFTTFFTNGAEKDPVTFNGFKAIFGATNSLGGLATIPLALSVGLLIAFILLILGALTIALGFAKPSKNLNYAMLAGAVLLVVAGILFINTKGVFTAGETYVKLAGKNGNPKEYFFAVYAITSMPVVVGSLGIASGVIELLGVAFRKLVK